MDVTKGFIEHIVYPGMETLRGNRIRSYFRELKLSEDETREIIEANKRTSLKRLLHHCIDNVPAYQRLSRESCPCGRPFKVLQQVEGRENDIFISRWGALVHPSHWNNVVAHMSGIKKYQLIQHDTETITLKIVKNDKFNTEEADYFIRQIRDVLGEVKVTVVYHDEIEPMPSGKVRYAYREF